jgi:Tol biopolymer transport system component
MDIRTTRADLPILVVLLALGTLAGACSGGGGTGSGTSSFTITTTAAPFGIVGNSYNVMLTTSGGTPPFTWSQAGTLPAGLNPINPTTGTITGTPTSPGNSTVTFTVRDSAGHTATGPVLFAVHSKTDRVSVNNIGTPGDGASTTPSISGDGSLVAFVSQAANLVPGVSTAQSHIYVHNRNSNQVELVSRDSSVGLIPGNGISSQPVISTDGRFVAFVSQSTNLVPGAGAAGQQVYLRDRQTGQTSLVSKATNGVLSNGTVNRAPSISSNGQFIAFVSNATNLVNVISGQQQIYLRDTSAGTTVLVSASNDPVPIPGNGPSDAPSINSDGQFVAFSSLASNLSTVVGSNQQIFMHDRLSGPNGTTTLVSRDSGGNSGNGNSGAPSVSGDGRFVAFWSVATNLFLGPTGQQIYLHDRNTGVNGTNSLVSRDLNVPTQGGNGVSSNPVISLNGQVVAFASLSTNLVTGITGPQVYSRDSSSGVTALVTRDNNTQALVAGTGTSASPSISSDGSSVAFSSSSPNLVTVPPVAPSDIYVRALP